MKNLSFRAKLFTLVGFLIAVSMVIGGISFVTLNKVSSNYAVIKDINFPNTKNLLESLVLLRASRIEVLNLAIPGTTAEADKKSMDRIAENWGKILEYDKAYLSVPFQPGEESVYNEYKASLNRWKATQEKAIEMYLKNEDENSPERKAMTQYVLKEFAVSARDVREKMDLLLDYHAKSSKDSGENAVSAENAGRAQILTIGLLGIAVGLGFAVLLTANLVKTFTTIANSLSDASNQVSAASAQIASSAEELSSATTEQAASLEQTASAIEEMSSMVTKSSDNSRQASDVSEQSHQSAQKGKNVVEEMIQAIGDINTSNTNIMQQIDESNRQIAEIVTVISEIGNKTKVINDIVFQTKLLSFNASVEAARAGEHGKGFAVVAEEVGNLAQMSGNAAKEISSMLEGSIQKVEGIVRDTKEKVERLVSEGKMKVEQGTRIAHECGEVLNEIVTNVSSVSSMSNEISTASREQAQGIGEITKAMNQLDQVTQQNAATSEEAASAAEELSAQAESMKALVSTLVRAVEGGATRPGGEQAWAPAPVKSTAPAVEKTGKVVALPKRPGSKAAPAGAERKSAAADGTVPSYDHPEFKES